MFFGREASTEGPLDPKFGLLAMTPLEAFEAHCRRDRKLDFVLKVAWWDIVDVIVFAVVNLDLRCVEEPSHVVGQEADRAMNRMGLEEIIK